MTVAFMLKGHSNTYNTILGLIFSQKWWFLKISPKCDKYSETYCADTILLATHHHFVYHSRSQQKPPNKTTKSAKSSDNKFSDDMKKFLSG